MHTHSRSLPSCASSAGAAAVALLFGAAALADTPAFHWIRGGHGAQVQAVAASPDGQLAASASEDGTVKLWRLADGRLRRTLVTSDDQVFGLGGVLFSPDGSMVVGSGTGGATVWRVADGQVLQTLLGLETGYGLAFSPDAQLVAVAGSIDGLEEATRVFRISDGQLVQTLVGPDNFYGLSVVFAPDGQSLFVARGSPFSPGNAGAITQYRLSDASIIRTLSGHTRRVGWISLSPDGATLVSASEDASVRFWRISDGAAIGVIPDAHTGEVNQVRFSPDGLSLVSAGLDGLIRIWRGSDHALLRTIAGHTGSVSSAAWTHDGQRLLSVGGRLLGYGGDSTVRLWSAADGTPIDRFTDLTARSPLLSFAPAAQQIAVSDAYDPIQIRRTSDGALVRTIAPGDYTTGVALAPAGDRLATGTFNAPVRLWNVATASTYASIPIAANATPSMAFSPDGQFVVAGTWNEGLHLHRVSDGGLVRAFTASAQNANRPSFTADSSLLIAAGGISAMVWRVADGSLVRAFPVPAFAAQVAVITPDGTLAATAGSEPNIRIWQVSDGSLVRMITSPQWSVGALAFTADGQYILSGSEYYDHTLRMWRISDGVEVATIDEQNGTGIDSMFATPDGRRILLSRLDGVVAAIHNPSLPACPADANADGVVNLADLAVLLSHFGGSAEESPATGDVDDDGDVDLSDLAALLGAFGSTCQ